MSEYDGAMFELMQMHITAYRNGEKADSPSERQSMSITEDSIDAIKSILEFDWNLTNIHFENGMIIGEKTIGDYRYVYSGELYMQRIMNQEDFDKMNLK